MDKIFYVTRCNEPFTKPRLAVQLILHIIAKDD